MTRRRVEGQLVDVDSGEPEYYVASMTRRRRFFLWFFRSGTFEITAAIVMVVACLIWRLPAVMCVVGLIAGWYAGWWCAKESVNDDGELPPL